MSKFKHSIHGLILTMNVAVLVGVKEWSRVRSNTNGKLGVKKLAWLDEIRFEVTDTRKLLEVNEREVTLCK